MTDILENPVLWDCVTDIWKILLLPNVWRTRTRTENFVITKCSAIAEHNLNHLNIGKYSINRCNIGDHSMIYTTWAFSILFLLWIEKKIGKIIGKKLWTIFNFRFMLEKRGFNFLLAKVSESFAILWTDWMPGKAHQTMKNKSFLILIKKHFCTSSLRIDWCITITYRPTSCLWNRAFFPRCQMANFPLDSL